MIRKRIIVIYILIILWTVFVYYMGFKEGQEKGKNDFIEEIEKFGELDKS